MGIKNCSVSTKQLEYLRNVLKSLHEIRKHLDPHRGENELSDWTLNKVDQTLAEYYTSMECNIKFEESEESEPDVHVLEPETTDKNPTSLPPPESFGSLSVQLSGSGSSTQFRPFKRPASPSPSTSSPGYGNNSSHENKRARGESGHDCSSNNASRKPIEIVEISDDDEEETQLKSLHTFDIKFNPNTTLTPTPTRTFLAPVPVILQSPTCSGNEIYQTKITKLKHPSSALQQPSSSSEGKQQGIDEDVKPRMVDISIIPASSDIASPKNESDLVNKRSQAKRHLHLNSVRPSRSAPAPVTTTNSIGETKEKMRKGRVDSFDAANIENNTEEDVGRSHDNSTVGSRMYSSDDENSSLTGSSTASEEVEPVASEDPEPANQAFKIRKVVQNIFKYLNAKDLKSCRFATRFCSLEAAKLLRNKRLKRLKITKTWVTFKRSTASLQEFSRLIQASTYFPCDAFEFSAKSLESVDVRNFFDAHGDIVRDVEMSNLNYDANDNQSTTKRIQHLLGDLLAKRLPNLLVLEVPKSNKLNLFPEVTDIEPAEHSTFQLSALRDLYLTGSGKIEPRCLSQLLKNAVNLKYIYCNNLTAADLELLLELNAIHLVKHFKFDFSRSRSRSINIDIDLYSKLAQQQPEFKRLDNLMVSRQIPPELLVEIGKVLKLIITSSSEKLYAIDNFHPVGHIPNLELPTLKSVRQLRLFYKNDFLNLQMNGAPVPMLPPGLHFIDKFPNLNNVKISFDCRVFENLQPHQIFPGQNAPILSVKELIVWYTCDKDEEDGDGVALGSGIPTCWVKYFCEFFPNLIVVYFEFLQDFGSAGKYLWRLHDLRELTLEIELNDKVNKNPFPLFDATLTGFSRAKVKELYEQVPGDITLSQDDARALRVKPSIVDLRHLNLLSISFIDLRSAYNKEKKNQNVGKGGKQQSKENAWKKNVILSHVTGMFAFKMCPQLNVRVKNIKIKLRASEWYNRQAPFKSLQQFVPTIPFSIRT